MNNIYLPKIYPDELVYSWFARYDIREGFIGNLQALSMLYNRDREYPNKEFIGNINESTRECINDRYGMKNIALNHTMYPQYARFIPLDKRKEMLHDLVFSRLIYQPNPRHENEQYFKYCPICSQEDREQYGETYWHREHQIRNIMICTKHKCFLNNSNLLFKSHDRRDFVTAETVIPYEEKCESVDNQTLINFAAYEKQLFTSPINLTSSISIQAILHHFIKDSIYKPKSGRYRDIIQLTKDIQECYTHMTNEVATRSKIQNVLMENSYDFSTIVQLGFFLQIPVEFLTNPKLNQEDIQLEKDMHYIEPDWEQYDNDIEKKVESICYNTYSGKLTDGKPAKVMQKIICQKLGIKEHELRHLSQCKSLIEKYSEPYPELWARRLIWAYNKLVSEYGEYNFDMTTLIHLSGIVKKNFDQIHPYLPKHANKETVNKITNIILLKA